MDRQARRLAAFLTACAVFAFDRWSKAAVEATMGAYDTRVVVPGFFNIVRSGNPGVAFGILADNASHFRTLSLVAVSLVAVVVLLWILWRIDRHDALTATGLSLILGGAAGNVYDRALHGAVTDFLDFYAGSWHWYTFNVADSAICVGAGLLLLSTLRSGPRKEAHA